MLQINRNDRPHPFETEGPPPQKPLDEIFSPAILWRRRRLVALVALVFVGLAGFYLAVRPDSYQATAQLIVENRVLQTNSQDMMFASASAEAGFVRTQMAILGSDMILMQVVENLGLADDNAFISQPVGFRAALGDLAAGIRNHEGLRTAVAAVAQWTDPAADGQPSEAANTSAAEDWRARAALWVIRSNLVIANVGGGSAIEIRYVAADARRAAEVVNEMMRVHLLDQGEENARASRAASAWLRERLSGLGATGRVIAEAVPPARPQGPAAILVLSAGLAVGLAFGIAAAWAREFLGDAVRTPDEVVAVTASEHLGYLPHARGGRIPRRRPATGGWDPAVAIRKGHGTLSWALDRPLSVFTHTLRRIDVAMESPGLPGVARTLGVTSTMRGEGRTLVAANLAQVIAASGRRVLLVDAVPYDGRLSAMFGCRNAEGLLEVLRGRTSWRDCAKVDGRTGLGFLPLGRRDGKALPAHLWSGDMARLLKELEGEYDRVIFDMPPLVPVPDVRAAARHLDGFLLVIGWGRVSAEGLTIALSWAGEAREKLIGSVFNKVRMSEVRSADFPGSRRPGRHYVARRLLGA